VCDLLQCAQCVPFDPARHVHAAVTAAWCSEHKLVCTTQRWLSLLHTYVLCVIHIHIPHNTCTTQLVLSILHIYVGYLIHTHRNACGEGVSIYLSVLQQVCCSKYVAASVLPQVCCSKCVAAPSKCVAVSIYLSPHTPYIHIHMRMYICMCMLVWVYVRGVSPCVGVFVCVCICVQFIEKRVQ